MKYRTVILVLIAEAVVILLGTSRFGWTVEGLQAATRFSGRLSLFIFSFIFLLHPRNKTTLATFLSEQYFLIFAIAHGIHLIELLSYVYLSGIQLVPYRLAGGFLAYSLIFLMPWLQARVESGKLNPLRFESIGYVYSFYVWFIFFMTYVSRVNGSFPNAGGNHLEHVILMGWVCVLLGIKLAGLLLKRTSQA